ncbi:hypothetical protein B0I35DRAFT_414054 [Stachybotrys elegans]|uniref:Aminoglycoside phosphotransferase domain-containing protein n=1 Tax=Stachybotrys elegans TaxID=80388 RepID=A0A8K0SB18_9HYPO|nr:hypothetical protein B0I35DRAFT_414054 [Stachybotrys elegans]
MTAGLKDSSKGQVIHGDFRTGNILVPNAQMPQHGRNVTLLVVDWEMMQLIPAGLWMLEAMVRHYPECLEKSAAIGNEIIVHAWHKDCAWFEKSDLACIFRQVR